MASTSLIKALGLDKSTNALEAAPGTLYEASNVIIRRDDVIESRRGYDIYGVPFGSASDRCKQMAEYKNKLLRHYSNKLQFEYELNNAGEMEFLTFDGDYTEAVPGRRFRSIESAGNFFFTTSEGIKKISAKTASDFSTSSNYISQAGGINAIDIEARVDLIQGETGGYLPQDSVVAYKIVWGYKDRNDVLVLGAPSDFVTVYNTLSTSLILDFNKLLNSLDDINQTGSMINDGDYVSSLGLDATDSPLTLKNNLTALSTKIDEDIVYVDGSNGPLLVDTVTVNNGVVTVNFYQNKITSIPQSSFDSITAINQSAFSSITNIPLSPYSSITGVVSIGSTISGTIIGNTSTSSILWVPTGPSEPPVNLNGQTVLIQSASINGLGVITTGWTYDTKFSVWYAYVQFSFTVPITPVDPVTITHSVTSLRITCSNSFSNGNSVTIKDSNTTPSIDGTYTIFNTTSTYFDIPYVSPVYQPAAVGKAFKLFTQSLTVTANNTFSNNDVVVITNSNCSPNIDGTYVVSGVTPTTFNITIVDKAITATGNTGKAFKNAANTVTVVVNNTYSNGDTVTIKDSNSSAVIDGTYIISGVTPTSYNIIAPLAVVTAGTTGKSFKSSANTITLLCANNFTIGEQVVIANSNSTPSIDGTYTITARTPSSFNIVANVAVITAGNFAYVFKSGQSVSDYFSENDKILLSGFKSNPLIGYPVTEFNKKQTAVNVNNYSLQFIPEAYSSTNPAGIYGSGSIEAGDYTNVPFQAVITSNKHGLTTGQKILVSSCTSTVSTGAGVSDLNGVYEVEVLTPSTFRITLPFTAYSSIAVANGPYPNNTFTTPSAHQFINNTPIVFTTTGTLQSPFTLNTTYYIKNVPSGPSPTTFELSSIIDGSSIQATNSGSGTFYANKKFIISAGTLNWAIYTDNLVTDKIESYNFRSISTPDDPSSPATHVELTAIQTYYNQILSLLKNTKTNVISQNLKDNYINNIISTQNSNVIVDINIPKGIEKNVHFYRVYRSKIITAIDIDVITNFTANQEYVLIEENFPTDPELTAKYVSFLDDIPETSAVTGSYLYTNEINGQGALQANNPPPYATDINVFKNYVFYSNTKQKHKKLLNVLPTQAVIDSYDPLNKPKIIFTTGDTQSEIYTFVLGVQQLTNVTCSAASAGLDAKYFTLNSAYDETQYYVWYSVIGVGGVDPSPAGKRGIEVVVNSTDVASVVAQKTASAINSLCLDFSASIDALTPTQVDILNFNYGLATNSTDHGTGFTITTTPGAGENALQGEVLLSDGGGSPSLSIEETAKSLVRVINRKSSFLSSGYISTLTIGTILIEAATLTTPKFYLIANGNLIGNMFNPPINPEFTISGVSTLTSEITTSSNHGLTIGDQVVLYSETTTPDITGLQTVTSVTGLNTFKIDKTITAASSPYGFMSRAAVAEASDNEAQKHRVYYSKYAEAEAVPILNYIDIGTNDKEILRIFPLRDSLFVFKEDGLYRISGQTAPFTLSLFDSSCLLIAPDSLDVSNNQLFCWTTQGVSVVSESGVNIISRPIDVDILKIATYPNFKTATWGIGYESDTSYTVYTTNEYSDTDATIGYRYSSLTSSWTTIDKDYICGINKTSDDLLYLAPNDVNYIEKERKSFSRYDYADREIVLEIANGSYSNSILRLPSVSDISVGDVLVQTQDLSVYEFNALLQKLDNDLGIPSTDYYSSLRAVAGDDLRNKLEDLAVKLDIDLSTSVFSSSIGLYSGPILTVSPTSPAVVTTSLNHNLLSTRYVQISGVVGLDNAEGDFNITKVSNTQFSIPIEGKTEGTGGNFITLTDSFEDIKSCYNIIITKLNENPTVVYNNYNLIDTTTVQEAIIIAVDKNARSVTLNMNLDYVVGPVSVFQAIPCSFVYNPNLMGDPLSFKHLREATLMFINKAFTTASLVFSTDLLPEFIEVPFSGSGSGIFGHQGFGDNFFGGASNSIPFRTYIPRQCQRCRYINVGFQHSVAREQFGIYGLTLTGETGISTRAYR